jgi:FkbM family methyltransferase
MINFVVVGAYEGDGLLKLMSAHQITKANTNVYAFEPDADSFRCLNKKRDQIQNLTLLPFAVGLGDNQEALFHYPNGMSTTASPYFRPEQPDRFAMVWTMRLDSFMRLYDLEGIDYLLIDVPFCEEECLESLADYYQKVAYGFVHVYGDQHIIAAWLGDHGFSMDARDHGIHFWRTIWDIR